MVEQRREIVIKKRGRTRRTAAYALVFVFIIVILEIIAGIVYFDTMNSTIENIGINKYLKRITMAENQPESDFLPTEITEDDQYLGMKLNSERNDDIFDLAPPLTIVGVGDISLGRGVITALDEGDEPFLPLNEVILGADLAIGNLECALTYEQIPIADKGLFGGSIFLRGYPEDAHHLADAGLDIVSLANNHTMDFGETGLRDTKNALDSVGVKYCGAGDNLTEAYSPTEIIFDDYQIYSFSFSEVEPRKYSAGENKAGIAWFDINEAEKSIDEVREFADLIIVSLHWGSENRTQPTSRQRKIAHRLIDAGVDIILGHHSHVLGPVEYYNGGVIAFSLGNFVFDTVYASRRKTAILTVKVNRSGGIREFWLTPCQIEGVTPKVQYP